MGENEQEVTANRGYFILQKICLRQSAELVFLYIVDTKPKVSTDKYDIPKTPMCIADIR